jgi:chromosome partitioning protein
MITTVGFTKGGVGKTTAAIEIAAELSLSGRRVWLVDADRQRTAQKAIGVRADNEQLAGISCDSYIEGKDLLSQVSLKKDLYDEIIIDAGGRDSSALRAAMGISDRLLIPVAPRSFELWALEDMAELVDIVRDVNEGLKVFAFLNMAETSPMSTDNRVAVDMIREFGQFEYLPTMLKARKVFSSAAGAGMSVTEMRPKDPKAVFELKALIKTVFNI